MAEDCRTLANVAQADTELEAARYRNENVNPWTEAVFRRTTAIVSSTDFKKIS